MSGAEFRVLRESLGLGRDAVANMLGIKARNVARWELREDAFLPNQFLDQVLTWARDADELVAQCIEQLAGEPAPTLTTYRSKPYGDYPASWHRAVAARVAERIPTVRITYAD